MGYIPFGLLLTPTPCSILQLRVRAASVSLHVYSHLRVPPTPYRGRPRPIVLLVVMAMIERALGKNRGCLLFVAWHFFAVSWCFSALIEGLQGAFHHSDSVFSAYSGSIVKTPSLLRPRMLRGIKLETLLTEGWSRHGSRIIVTNPLNC